MKIWIDADACPKTVKEITYKVSSRLKISVTLVANAYLAIPHSPYISFVKVDAGADMADNYISEHANKDDIVITADIPLAAELVNQEIMTINPRGETYSAENINERLSMRNFMQELRDNGVQTGGPPPLDAKAKELFTNALDRILTQKLKGMNE